MKLKTAMFLFGAGVLLVGIVEYGPPVHVEALLEVIKGGWRSLWTSEPRATVQ